MSSTSTKSALALCVACALVQVSCTKVSVTLPEHMRVAQEYCASNGGLASIEDADASKEVEGCGYKCSRYTGRVRYEASFTCGNGAKFSMKWTPDVKLPQ